MNKKLLLSALVAGLGGLLFGFDTAVISGAEQAIKLEFNLDGFWHGFTNAVALIGAIVGAMFSGRPGDRFGRRNLLIALAVFYAVSATGCAVTESWFSFLFYRFLGGLGVGASSVLGPMYIAEIAPANLRGRLVAIFQFNIIFGILLAFFSNYVVNRLIADEAWRWMLGVEVVPAVVFFFLLFRVPETPRWLIRKNKDQEARETLEKLGAADSGRLVEEIKESLKEERAGRRGNLFNRKYSFPVLLAVLLATFNQFSGINAIMYYAPRIFGMTGVGVDAALLQSVVIGFTNMVFTILAMFIIDRLGRKKLLIIGSAGMILTLGSTALSLYTQNFSGYNVLIYLIGFIASFAFSQGAVVWVFLSEIFPNSVRAKGQALGSLTHWVWAAIVTWTFPVVVELNFGGAMAFSFFAICMALQLLFVVKFLPETKGKSLEELQSVVLK